MPAHPLTEAERVEIRVGLELGESVAAIARRLRRCRQSISAEINRNGGRDRYCALAAQRRAVAQRHRPKTPKMVRDRALGAHVARRLRCGDSPMTISIELRRGVHGRTSSISHECIYQAIYRCGRGLPDTAHQHLHLRRRKRKHRHHQRHRSHSLGEFSLIHDRPAIANERTQIGHFEGDLIVGAYNRSAAITVFDRASRYNLLSELPDGKHAAGVTTALIRLLRRIPPHLRHTLTWDQGAELADHAHIAHATGIDIYFADPKSPWQRPTNENGNALVRRWLTKGTDLTAWTPRRLRRVEHRINTIPRRSLNWATATDIYNQNVTMTD